MSPEKLVKRNTFETVVKKKASKYLLALLGKNNVVCAFS